MGVDANTNTDNTVCNTILSCRCACLLALCLHLRRLYCSVVCTLLSLFIGRAHITILWLPHAVGIIPVCLNCVLFLCAFVNICCVGVIVLARGRGSVVSTKRTVLHPATPTLSLALTTSLFTFLLRVCRGYTGDIPFCGINFTAWIVWRSLL